MFSQGKRIFVSIKIRLDNKLTSYIVLFSSTSRLNKRLKEGVPLRLFYKKAVSFHLDVTEHLEILSGVESKSICGIAFSVCYSLITLKKAAFIHEPSIKSRASFADVSSQDKRRFFL